MRDETKKAPIPPAVGQTWDDGDGAIFTIIAVDSAGAYPVQFRYADGTVGRCEINMDACCAPTNETWGSRVASLEAEVQRLREALEGAEQRGRLAEAQRIAGMMDETLLGTGLAKHLDARIRDLQASAPTSGQGAAATCESVCAISGKPCPEGKYKCHALGCQAKLAAEPGAVCEHSNLLRRCWHCNEHPRDAPAAQPATRRCGTCGGSGHSSYFSEGGRCHTCGGTGTTPRKEGP